MSRLLAWIYKRFGTFDLLPQYFMAAGQQIQNVLWGALLPFLIWGIWFIVSNPPAWVNVTAVGVALFLAGYFVWKADHVRLIPKLGVGDDIDMKFTGIGVPDKKKRTVQVLVKCETEGPVKDCRGQLLRVSKWAEGDGKWEITHINETLDLEWSYVDPPTFITLEHGAPRQLNVFWVENTHRDIVTCTRFHPRLAVTPSDRLKFDVRVAGEDCPPLYVLGPV
jgi:hypothetical protein